MTGKLSYIILIALLAFSIRGNASHIVGGDVTYEYIELDTYLIKVNLYLDCENGIPGAIELDRMVNVSYFNSRTNELIDNDGLPVLTETRVEEVNYKCLETQPNACVVEFTFSYKKIIDPGNDGITIAYQRCCRNSTIDNLVDPGRTGATFFAKIPPRTIVENNSSASFEKLPPNFLCTNAPLIFDHRATDKDGDSLVYSIILPYLGADYINNRPVPAGAPPYLPVQMKSPYNAQDIMSGTARLQIDRQTGLLTVTPSEVGQFVMAVLVEEYRNGTKIAEIHRDYQLNVLDCALSVVADFIPSGERCDSLRLFQNTSVGRDLFYNWRFHNGETFNTKNSEKKYPVPGIYEVTLIVSNDGCVDSITKIVEIQPSHDVFSDLLISPLEGCDSLTINIIWNYIQETSNTWSMGDDLGYFEDTMLTRYFYNNPGEYVVNFSLTDSNTCNIRTDTSINVKVNESIKHKVDFNLEYLNGCELDGKINIESISTAKDIEWDFGNGFISSDKDLANYNYQIPGDYTVWFRTKDTGKCVKNDSMSISIEIDEFGDSLGKVSLYNIFTPGNDNLNNCFQIDLKDYTCISVSYKIYNRWGELVFVAESAADCWDGTHYTSGTEFPEGEYFGVYTLTKHDNSERRLSNVITLKR